MAWRLNSAAEAIDLRQVQVAEALGERPATVGNWFQGLNFPRKRQRREVAALLRVSEAWLFEGGEDRTPATVLEEPTSSTGYTAVREIPVVSWTHAGAAANYEEIPKHGQGSVASTSRDRKAFALTIEGDSMEPKFFAGDRVVLEPSSQPINGKPVVAKFVDDAVQLRIYTKLPNGKIRLAPYNPIYPTIEHTAKEFAWIWPVRELVRSV